MARIFSIQFTYENVEHHAMVSMRTTPFFAEYSVVMLDDSITAHLPNTKIISTSRDSFVFSDSTEENRPALMREILRAVARYMQTVDA
jgi:hypothetical protein